MKIIDRIVSGIILGSVVGLIVGSSFYLFISIGSFKTYPIYRDMFLLFMVPCITIGVIIRLLQSDEELKQISKK